MMNDNTQSSTTQTPDLNVGHTVCPFCALVCDDLSLPRNDNRLQTAELPCARARDGFDRAAQAPAAQPLLRGAPVGLDEALQHAGALLRAAQRPLFDGLLGDLQDARAAWRLAAHFGGSVDHRDGDALARNLRVFQDSGWQIASLGEIRNRADQVIRIGEFDLPRLDEKLFDVSERLQIEQAPAITHLQTDTLRVVEQLCTLMRGSPLPNPLPQAESLQQQLQQAQFPVFLLGKLEPPHAELILRAVVGLVREINETRRAALLTLGDGMGAETAQLCGSWHSGFGIRTDFSRGYPRQDLQTFAGERLLVSGEADLRIWIGSLDDAPPPPCEQPSIVFGHPGMRFDNAPELYLPISIPGVHRKGYIHRGDGLRLLPLEALQPSDLPSSLALAERLIAAHPNRSNAC